MAQNILNGTEVLGMVTHWLDTPPNGYLGSDYGSDPQALLHAPMAAAGLGDAFLDKMRQDVPVIGALPDRAVNVHLEKLPNRNDGKRLLIEVLDSVVSVSQSESRGE